jgi:DNA-binding NarL/FixJ family response regulator
MSSRPLQLMVIAADPTLRKRLHFDLQPFPDLQIVAETRTLRDALRGLEGWVAGAGIDVVLLDFQLSDRSTLSDLDALGFCQQLSVRSPLPIVLLTTPDDPNLPAAFHQGIAGCCVKGSAVSDLVTALRRVATGQRYWTPQILPGLPIVQGQSLVPLKHSDALTGSPTTWNHLRRQMRLQGLDQIDAALMTIAVQLRSPTCTTFDRWFLIGRQRELRTARWIVQKLLATAPVGTTRTEVPSRSNAVSAVTATSTTLGRSGIPRSSLSRSGTSQALVPTPADLITPKTLEAQILDSVTAKLQANLTNGTNIPLEIDLFKESKKRQLFYTILRQLEELLDELRTSQTQPEQLRSQRSIMLQDLWQAIVLSFFGKYYAIPVQQQSVNVTATLLQAQDTVQAEILDPIPLVPELFSYLLWQTPLSIDEVAYPSGHPTAQARATALVEHLIIQIACAVVQPLLNAFADNDTVKQDFYDRRLLSTREIERFRNDLSWKYRITRYVSDPQAIFESRYWLWEFTELGLQRSAIYAPRGNELDRLGGIQLAVTLALETRDAVAPRLSAAVAWVGRGVVYFLTEIIGRSIGLIGRGIVKGIGDVWQERRR